VGVKAPKDKDFWVEMRRKNVKYLAHSSKIPERESAKQKGTRGNVHPKFSTSVGNSGTHLPIKEGGAPDQEFCSPSSTVPY